MFNTRTTNYDKFICIADKCPCSCCKGWAIVIDNDKLMEYLSLSRNSSEPYVGRLYNGINWEEGTFKQYNGRCAMLGDNEFCDLQLEAGEGMLCKTCRQYPRHVEEFEDVREWSLSLSCPEAARIILTNESKLEFIQWDSDEQEDYDEYDDFDYYMYSQLFLIRPAIYDIIQDRELSFSDKAEVLVGIALCLQQMVDENLLCDVDELEQVIRNASDHKDILDYIDDRIESIDISVYREKRLFSKLFELEHLSDRWAKICDAAWDEWQDELHLSDSEEIIAEQLLMFWVYTYFCGSVYDDCVFSKLMLAVCSTYWIFQISRCENLDGDVIKAAYSFAREIEHSDINLMDLEGWFMELLEQT